MKINTDIHVFRRGAILDLKSNNLFMPSIDSSTLMPRANSPPTKGCLISLYYYYHFIAIPVLNAKVVDPDQMPFCGVWSVFTLFVW